MGLITGMLALFVAFLLFKVMVRSGKLGVNAIDSFFDKLEDKL